MKQPTKIAGPSCEIDWRTTVRAPQSRQSPKPNAGTDYLEFDIPVSQLLWLLHTFDVQKVNQAKDRQIEQKPKRISPQT